MIFNFKYSTDDNLFEIRHMMPREIKRHLDFTKGIYIFWTGEECLYVGTSTRICYRLRQHFRHADYYSYEWIDDADRLTTIDSRVVCSDAKRRNIHPNRIEYYLINQLNAKYNQQLR